MLLAIFGSKETADPEKALPWRRTAPGASGVAVGVTVADVPAKSEPSEQITVRNAGHPSIAVLHELGGCPRFAPEMACDTEHEGLMLAPSDYATVDRLRGHSIPYRIALGPQW